MNFCDFPFSLHDECQRNSLTFWGEPVLLYFEILNEKTGTTYKSEV